MQNFITIDGITEKCIFIFIQYLKSRKASNAPIKLYKSNIFVCLKLKIINHETE